MGTVLITFHETKVESKRSEMCCSIMRSPNRSSGFLQGLIKCKQILWMLNFLPFLLLMHAMVISNKEPMTPSHQIRFKLVKVKVHANDMLPAREQ